MVISFIRTVVILDDLKSGQLYFFAASSVSAVNSSPRAMIRQGMFFPKSASIIVRRFSLFSSRIYSYSAWPRTWILVESKCFRYPESWSPGRETLIDCKGTSPLPSKTTSRSSARANSLTLIFITSVFTFVGFIDFLLFVFCPKNISKRLRRVFRLCRVRS